MNFTPHPTKTILLPMVFSLLKDLEKPNPYLPSLLNFLQMINHAVERNMDFAPQPTDPEFLRTTILPKVIKLQHKLRNENPTLEEAAADITDMQLAIWAYLQRRETQ